MLTEQIGESAGEGIRCVLNLDQIFGKSEHLNGETKHVKWEIVISDNTAEPNTELLHVKILTYTKKNLKS